MTDTKIAERVETMPAPVTPMDMLNMAVSQGADLDKLEKLMELKERYDRDEAKKAFHQAVAEFKRNPPRVVKDKINSQYDSRYVSKSGLVNTVNPVLSEHGLSAHWEPDQSQDGLLKVTCVLTHRLGHSESASMSAPPDNSGKKNPIQQLKSTKTYLEIATFESVTGVAACDSGDDDGNSAGKQTEDPLATIREAIMQGDWPAMCQPRTESWLPTFSKLTNPEKKKLGQAQEKCDAYRDSLNNHAENDDELGALEEWGELSDEGKRVLWPHLTKETQAYIKQTMEKQE